MNLPCAILFSSLACLWSLTISFLMYLYHNLFIHHIFVVTRSLVLTYFKSFIFLFSRNNHGLLLVDRRVCREEQQSKIQRMNFRPINAKLLLLQATSKFKQEIYQRGNYLNQIVRFHFQVHPSAF